MHLAVLLLPLALLALAANPSPTPDPPPLTLVDILSSHAQYSYFLRHIQKHGLVPLLNSLHNVTLLAPVNLAFARAPHPETKESLLRYLVSLPLRVANLGHALALYSTLYQIRPGLNYTVKVSPDSDSQQYVFDDYSPAIDPDISAKHQSSFLQPIEQLLPLKPTLCDWLLNDTDDSLSNLSWTIKLLKLLSLGTPSAGKDPVSCSALFRDFRTLFIPTDSYIANVLSSLVSKYYTSLYASSGKYLTTARAQREIRHDILLLLSGLGESEYVLGLNGTGDGAYSLDPHSRLVTVRNQVYANRTVALADAVVHIFDVQPASSFFSAVRAPLAEMVPRKALYAYRFSNFVRELYFRKLGHLVDGQTANFTLFLEKSERDDMVDNEYFARKEMYRGSGGDIHVDEKNTLVDVSRPTTKLVASSFTSRQSLMYHFAHTSLPSLVSVDQSPTDFMVSSMLCSQHKVGGCFRLKVSRSWRHGHPYNTLNGDIAIQSLPHPLGNASYLYLADQEIDSPSSFKTTMGNLILNGGVPQPVDNIAIDAACCLRTMNFLKQFGLFSLDNNNKGYTALLPCRLNSRFPRDSWDRLGLVLVHLQNSPSQFRKALQLLILEGTVYSDYGLSTSTLHTMRNLNGDSVYVHHRQLHQQENRLDINGTRIALPLNSDVLFSQGVAHIVDSVLLFNGLHWSFLDLLRTTSDDTRFPGKSLLAMIQMIPQLRDEFGLDLHRPSQSRGPSLLVPTTLSLVDQNVTTSFARIKEFFAFHTLNNTEAAKLTRCIEGEFASSNHSALINTNLQKQLLHCTYNPHTGKARLQLVSLATPLLYNKDHEIQVVSHGCVRQTSLDHVGLPQCVFLVDKPLNLQWLDRGGDFLHVHLGFLSVGIGMILGLLVMVAVMALLLWYLLRRASRRRVPERMPLFVPHERTPFMAVILDEENGLLADHGYETDIEFARGDMVAVPWPAREPRKKHGYGATVPRALYGSAPGLMMSPASRVSAPRSIKGANLSKGLERDRNLPGFPGP